MGTRGRSVGRCQVAVPSPVMDAVRRQLRDHADGLVRTLARVGIELEYDHAGVRAIDRYVEDNRALWSADDCDRMALAIGAFLGECMVAVYGGQWREDAERGPGVHLPAADITAFPLTKAGKHIRGDHSDSVASFFDVAGAIIAKGGIDRM